MCEADFPLEEKVHTLALYPFKRLGSGDLELPRRARKLDVNTVWKGGERPELSRIVRPHSCANKD